MKHIKDNIKDLKRKKSREEKDAWEGRINRGTDRL